MGSTIATGDRSVVADNSSVWPTEGSSLSTYRISGSGSVTAEGGSALNVTQNVTVDGSVTVADSTLTAKSAAVSNGNLSVSGASTVTTESVSVTNGSLDISGDAAAALAYFGLGEAGNGQETTLNLEEGMYEGAVTAVVDANNNIVSQTQ